MQANDNYPPMLQFLHTCKQLLAENQQAAISSLTSDFYTLAAKIEVARKQ